MVWVLGQFYENTALFYWFQGQNLLGDDQNSKKGGEVKKGEDQISRGEYFFLFYQLKVLSHFAPVSPDTILKERSLGQSQWLPCCFEYYDLDTRRNLKYFEQ